MFLHTKELWKTIISPILGIFSMFFVFLAGNYHNDTKIEKCASYASDVVANETRKGEYSSMIVEPNNKTSRLCDSETEFYNLYGIFAESKVTFAPLYNADKQLDIHIKDVDSSSLAIMYGGGVRTEEYNGHFKHRVYPIEMMFPDVQYFYDFKYVLYISQTQANSILLSKGIKPTQYGYTDEDYKSLLKTSIDLLVNGDSYKYIVQNVYYNSNYYYDALTEVVNDFVITSYYSYDIIANHLQHVYFLKPFEYQNYYMMRYVKNLYPSTDFTVTLGKENVTGHVSDESILSFYYSENYSSIICIFLTTIGILLFAGSITLLLLTKFSKQTRFIFLLLSLFCPYFILSIFSFYQPHSPLFSFYSLKINMFLLIGFMSLFAMYFLLRKTIFGKTFGTKIRYGEIYI